MKSPIWYPSFVQYVFSLRFVPSSSQCKNFATSQKIENSQYLGREQYLALYLSGGLVAGLASHFVKLATRSPVPSLGASGAVFAIFAASAYVDPYARMALFMMPFLNFSKEELFFGSVAFDSVLMCAGFLMRVGIRGN
jgi:membrane associated rhomboid family serine protease